MSSADAVPASTPARPVVGLLNSSDGDGFVELLRVDSLSVGRFTAAPGYVDQQQPHAEDEIYYVLAGDAVLQIEGTPHEVTAGSLAYVPRGVKHRFAQVTTELDVLVVFAPAENTLAHAEPAID